MDDLLRMHDGAHAHHRIPRFQSHTMHLQTWAERDGVEDYEERLEDAAEEAPDSQAPLFLLDHDQVHLRNCGYLLIW